MRLLFVSLLTTLSFVLHSQVLFEGRITYEAKIELTTDTVSMEEAQEDLGFDRMDYFVKDGYYSGRNYLKDELVSSRTYLKTDELVYYTKPNWDKAVISSPSKSKDTLIRFEYPVDTTVIMGEKCLKMIRYSTKDTSEVYVSTETQIGFESFKKHSLNSWNERLALTDGKVTFQFSMKMDGYNVTFTAIEKEDLNMNHGFFDKFQDKEKYAIAGNLDVEPKMIISDKIFNKCMRENFNSRGILFGFVFISYIVEVNGEITNTEITFAKDKKTRKRALKAFSLCAGSYTAGELNGTKVPVKVTKPLILGANISVIIDGVKQ